MAVVDRRRGQVLEEFDVNRRAFSPRKLGGRHWSKRWLGGKILGKIKTYNYVIFSMLVTALTSHVLSGSIKREFLGTGWRQRRVSIVCLAAADIA